MADRGIEEKRLSFINDHGKRHMEAREPSVLGWEVLDKDKDPVGIVDSLLVDTKEDRARYLDVQMDKEFIREQEKDLGGTGGEGAREFQPNHNAANIMIPIGTLRLKPDKNAVIAEIDRTTLAQLPRHAPGEGVDYELEKKVRFVLENNEGGTVGDPSLKGKEDIAYKSEHHTKGNENIGSRDPAVRRDVKSEENAAPPGSISTSAKADSQLNHGKLKTERRGETVGASEAERAPADEPRKRMQDQQEEMEQTKTSGSARRQVHDEAFYEDEKYDDERFYGSG